ncbi:MAG: FliM/FliN family flagellar motor switch protein [Planctomycetes bacterium]|nr:FliM/FliN family flagellar motor switch protein [Planctomycetota bacterium]
MSEDNDIGAEQADAARPAAEEEVGAAVATAGEPQAREAAGGGARAAPLRFPEMRDGAGGPESPLERVYDLTVPVTVELGKAQLTVQQILQLAPGSVVELDHSADAPVEMYVHGKCVAHGEIVVVDEFYGVRITSVA